ncbi:FAD-dependent oxidoreductase [Actinomadura harenae]|uniref:FAD-dependent oxidoreductase n=1 Tax=Actinomadura harenae TaxID=2483351 RepID=A0A3M2M3A1_9ACTN|nr:FAD-dependent oxidoreductase [Actinomadura harenae]RMI42955.1 FAD-dependent oxidoreductase [Actinomadura harenae]
MSARDVADVAVIGTGIIGLSTAWAVSGLGMRVLLVGPRSHTGQASAAAGAMLAPFSETAAGDDPLSSPAEITHRAAARASYGDWLARLRSESGRVVSMTDGIWLVATAHGQGDLEALELAARAARDQGASAEPHPPSEVPGLSPARTCPAHAALWLPGEASVDIVELLDALSHLLSVRENVRWADTSAVALEPGTAGSDGPLVVRCADRERYEAGRVVLAVGSGTGALAAASPGLSLGLPLVLAGKGVSVLVRDTGFALPTTVRTPMRRFACGAHLVPRAGGAAYLGATNRLTPPGETSTAPALEEILTVVQSVGDELNTGVYHRELADVAVGHRPYTLDHLPLVGPTEDPRVLAATATYRNGVLLAPYVAGLIAGHLSGAGPLDARPWRPTRPVAVPSLGEALGDRIQMLIDVLLPAEGVTAPWHLDLQALLGVAARHLVESPDDARWRPLHRLWDRAPVVETLPVLLRAVRDLPHVANSAAGRSPARKDAPSGRSKTGPVSRQRWRQHRLTPFGVRLSPAGQADLDELPPERLKSLLLREHLLLLRGFTGGSTVDKFEAFARRLGPLVVWGDAPIASVVAKAEPDDHVHDTGFMPLHWDGVYKPDTPDIQMFQCLKAVGTAASGGATLFSDTTRVIAGAAPGTLDLWRALTFRYERPLGGEMLSRSCPLVVEHPHTGEPTLRFTEPVPDGVHILNPPNLTLERAPSGCDSAEAIQQIRDALYDPRYMYAHRWRVGDIVLADNRALLHTREPYPPGTERHLLRAHVRIGDVAGDTPADRTSLAGQEVG